VYLLVDKAQKSIYSAKILEKNGNVYTYTVSNFNGKAVIPDAQFVFDKKKYPGVEEIDLR
ncbi:MAG: LolA family protein, partial [Sediminibacterium sp.]